MSKKCSLMSGEDYPVRALKLLFCSGGGVCVCAHAQEQT